LGVSEWNAADLLSKETGEAETEAAEEDDLAFSVTLRVRQGVNADVEGHHETAFTFASK
jgi:hypothetical protein